MFSSRRSRPSERDNDSEASSSQPPPSPQSQDPPSSYSFFGRLFAEEESEEEQEVAPMADPSEEARANQERELKAKQDQDNATRVAANAPAPGAGGGDRGTPSGRTTTQDPGSTSNNTGSTRVDRMHHELLNTPSLFSRVATGESEESRIPTRNATLAALLSDQEFVTNLTNQYANRDKLTKAIEAQADLNDEEMDVATLKLILLDSVNGKRILPEQVAEVEYIKDSQHLMLPYALGVRMDQANQQAIWVADHPQLEDRYMKVSTLTYEQLCAIVRASPTPEELKTAVLQLARPEGVPIRRQDAWDDPLWYQTAVLGVDGQSDAIFTTLSTALQFNCDLRDMGFLFQPNATVSDIAWKTATEVLPTRLIDHLRPYTKQCIAALNLKPCDDKPLGGWVRAYGVSLGIVPAIDSFCKKEITFVAKQPLGPAVKLVAQYHRDHIDNIYTLCANVLSMFGLFHLAKDHTFRTGDANMTRISTAYLKTLRTAVSQDYYNEFDGQKEVLVRTAPHPFGLAQTYFLAIAMGVNKMLTSPLVKRVTNTPPPVQRLMIMVAAMGEWAGLPQGKTLVELYEEELSVMLDEKAVVESSPPSYSDLHRCYGIAKKKELVDDAWLAINTMSPMVHGFIITVHTNKDTGADGLGHALSLANIARDQAGSTHSWGNAWQNLFDGLDGTSIIEFARAQLNNARDRDGRRKRK